MTTDLKIVLLLAYYRKLPREMPRSACSVRVRLMLRINMSLSLPRKDERTHARALSTIRWVKSTALADDYYYGGNGVRRRP